MRSGSRSAAAIALAAALGVIGVAAAGGGWARAQSHVELAFFDRERPDCWGLADGVAEAAVEGEVAARRCVYDLRATVQLEFPPMEGIGWVRLLARSEVTANSRRGGEPGHVIPVKGDWGGGIVLSWQAWSVTLLGSSRHCFDDACPAADAYNAIILRWEEQR